jgi:hypothetical protein
MNSGRIKFPPKNLLIGLPVSTNKRSQHRKEGFDLPKKGASQESSLDKRDE